MRRHFLSYSTDSSASGSSTAAMARGEQPVLSVVVPCANEQEVLRETNRRLVALLETLPIDFEIVYVDDGSTDSTPQILRELQTHDSRIRVVRFSRNFGHQVAITAGVGYSSGDAVVVIDADLQDPPELILEFVKRWQDGYDVVYGVRTERDGETALKLWTAKLFYRFINRLSDTHIPLDTGDFRLMDRSVVQALLAMPERDRFIRGMVSWLGFSQVAVPYRRASRLAGVTKYPLFKMLRFAIDGIVSFSVVPLRVATWLGLASACFALLGIVYALWAKVFAPGLVKGWTSILIAVLFIGGAQLVCLGVIGEYLGRIYGESKRRPLYVVREIFGFESNLQEVARTQHSRAAVGPR